MGSPTAMAENEGLTECSRDVTERICDRWQAPASAGNRSGTPYWLDHTAYREIWFAPIGTLGETARQPNTWNLFASRLPAAFTADLERWRDVKGKLAALKRTATIHRYVQRNREGRRYGAAWRVKQNRLTRMARRRAAASPAPSGSIDRSRSGSAEYFGLASWRRARSRSLETTQKAMAAGNP